MHSMDNMKPAPLRMERSVMNFGLRRVFALLAAGWTVWAITGTRPCLAETAASTGPKLLEVVKIWDQAPHNAFTDLIHHGGQWYCVFREGAGHVSPDGKIRVLASADGETWASQAVVSRVGEDLRDPKLSVTPSGQLMLVAAAAIRGNEETQHQTWYWLSEDGIEWSEPRPLGEPNQWLWRVTWHDGMAYGVSYDTLGAGVVRLYRFGPEMQPEILVENLFAEERPSEASLLFDPQGVAFCLLRRDGNPGHALLGKAGPPYTTWIWSDLARKIGGPHLLRLPDGRVIAAGRLYDGQVRTSLLWLDLEQGQAREFLELPSGGDTSYPGLVWHDGHLWVSYYSSHEGKTAIYLARVALPKDAPEDPQQSSAAQEDCS